MTRMTFSTLTAVAAVLTAPAMAQDTVTIGSAIALSGFVAPYDEGPMYGALIAIDELNAAGGVLGRQIEWVSADTASDPAQGANAAIEVLGQGAELVIVTCDFDFGAPAALVAQSQGVLTFSTCAADPKFGIQGIGDLAFTMATATAGQGALLAEWSYNEGGWRTVYVLEDTQVEYNRSLCGNFRTRWTELAGADSIVGDDTYNASTDTNIAAQVSEIAAAADAEFLFFCGAINGGSFLRQIRAGGVDMPIATGESMDGDYWLEAVPDMSDFYIAVYGSVFGDDPDPDVQAFFDTYEERYGRAVTAHSITGYSVVEAWARAVEEAGTFDAAAVRDVLESYTDEPMLIGPTTFTDELHITPAREMLMMEIQNGEYSALGRFAPESVPPITFE
ncbi:MAG: ABC transporter substrate-binding protein [Azospirillaceae bacterium]